MSIFSRWGVPPILWPDKHPAGDLHWNVTAVEFQEVTA